MAFCGIVAWSCEVSLGQLANFEMPLSKTPANPNWVFGSPAAKGEALRQCPNSDLAMILLRTKRLFGGELGCLTIQWRERFTAGLETFNHQLRQAVNFSTRLENHID